MVISPSSSSGNKVIQANQDDISDTSLIQATVDIYITKDLRKFANKNILLVAKALYIHSKLTFGKLQTETGLSSNLLNHALHEMKKNSFVTQNDKQYCLTNYCAALLVTINSARMQIKDLSGDGTLFKPHHHDEHRSDK